MALGQPDCNFFNKIRKLATDFVWSHSCNRVKYKKLIQGYHDGGLKLCDVETKYHSLKSIWVKKILLANRNSFWFHLAKYFLPLDPQLIWQCNISPGDVARVGGVESVWSGVWYSWSKLNYHAPQDKLEVLEQMLWCNSHIKRDSKVMINSRLLEAGLIQIKNIFSEQLNRFLTYQEICAGYNIQLDFLTYAGIIRAIPHHWKDILQNDVYYGRLDPILDNTQKAIEIPNFSKYVYIKILPPYKDTINLFWQNELKIDLPIPEWEKICYESPRVSVCVKLWYFQYRLLHRKLTTNLLQSKWDNEVSPMCVFCGVKAETVIHLFTECLVVVKFWKALFKWLKYTCDIQLNWSEEIQEEILFNNIKGKGSWFANNLLLIVKQYIYKTKCRNTKLKIVEVVGSLAQYERTEFLLALRKGKVHKHKQKWLSFYKAF